MFVIDCGKFGAYDVGLVWVFLCVCVPLLSRLILPPHHKQKRHGSKRGKRIHFMCVLLRHAADVAN